MRTVLITLALGGACLAYIPRAAACSCAPTALWRSDPQDGAAEVPLNQAIAIDGAFVASTVRLENERGEAVPFELNAGPGPGCPGTSADVIPRQPLEANTGYVLRVDSMFPSSEEAPSNTLHFTTGQASLPEVSLAPPSLSASVLHDAPVAMCGLGSTVFACIGIQNSDDLELIMRRGQQVLLRTTTVVQDEGTYALPETPDCIELRRRSRTGARSAPTSLCGEQLEDRAWSKEDSPDGFPSCQDGEIGASAVEATGCQLGAPFASSVPLLMLALLTHRRRR